MLCAVIQWVHSWASKGVFFFVCLFYSFSQNHHSLSSTIIQIAEKCPLWWSIASCQDAGLAYLEETGLEWLTQT